MEMINLFYIGVFAVAFLLMCYAFYEAKKDEKEGVLTSPKKTIVKSEEPSYDYTISEVNEYLLADFERIIKSGNLISYKVFQVNDLCFYFKDKNQWIIDGGIELHFNKGYFTIGFSSSLELMSFQPVPFEELYFEDNYIVLEEETEKIKALIGQKVIDVTFKTLELDEIVDYTMTSKKVSKLVEVILYFENNQMLQIATINYDLVENEPPKNYRYAISYDILISMNSIVKI